jgi:kynurenine formamidase
MCSPEIMARVRADMRERSTLTRRTALKSAFAASALATLAASPTLARQSTPMATPVNGGIRAAIVDLTHQMNPDIPVWPGNEPFSAEAVKTHETDGFYAQSLTFWEHTGTHVDAPIHFIDGAITGDMIDIHDLWAPLVVIDISARAAEDPDTAVTPEDIEAYEADYGPIPARALVAMNSGWVARWEDPAAFVNLDADGVQHYPGFHPDAADMLVNQRDIVGIAVDTLSQDPGNSTDFGTHLTILGAGKYGIEGLAHVGQMDAAGATVYVGAPKHANASGGPARVIGFNRGR